MAYSSFYKGCEITEYDDGCGGAYIWIDQDTYAESDESFSTIMEARRAIDAREN